MSLPSWQAGLILRSESESKGLYSKFFSNQVRAACAARQGAGKARSAV